MHPSTHYTSDIDTLQLHRALIVHLHSCLTHTVAVILDACASAVFGKCTLQLLG